MLSRAGSAHIQSVTARRVQGARNRVYRGVRTRRATQRLVMQGRSGVYGICAGGH